MSIDGFNNFSLRLLNNTFPGLYLIHDAYQFNDMGIQARKEIK
jgi:hypothetical protein